MHIGSELSWKILIGFKGLRIRMTNFRQEIQTTFHTKKLMHEGWLKAHLSIKLKNKHFCIKQYFWFGY